MFAPEGETAPAIPIYRKRAGHRERILSALVTHGPCTARALAALLALNVEHIHDAVRPLVVAGQVAVYRGAFRRHVYARVTP